MELAMRLLASDARTALGRHLVEALNRDDYRRWSNTTVDGKYNLDRVAKALLNGIPIKTLEKFVQRRKPPARKRDFDKEFNEAYTLWREQLSDSDWPDLPMAPVSGSSLLLLLQNRRLIGDVE